MSDTNIMAQATAQERLEVVRAAIAAARGGAGRHGQMTTAILSRPAPAAARTAADRAATLFADNYRCHLTPAGLIVTTPANRQYRVNADGCTCPASVTCKHLIGAGRLAEAQADAFCWEACALNIEADAARLGGDGAGWFRLRRQANGLERDAVALRAWSEQQSVETLERAA